MEQSRKLPSQERLRELFDYKDGELIWKITKGAAKAGSVAGCKTTYYKNKARKLIRIDGLFLAHRLIYKWHNNSFDESLQIDHINGDSNDNRIENLRAVSHQENMMNMKMRCDNKSGISGVHWDKSRNKWKAVIQYKGKTKMIGRYDSLDEATKARKLELTKLRFHANHGR